MAIAQIPQTIPCRLAPYPDIAGHQRRIIECIAEQGTPLFLCDRQIVIDRYRSLADCMAQHWPRHVVAYSFKTNYAIAASPVLRSEGAYAEVVSGFEYRMARELGYPGDRIVFNGPYKKNDELRVAIIEGALINVNHMGELDRLEQQSASAGVRTPVGVRLAATLGRLGHSRFGLSIESGEAAHAVETIRRSPNLDLVGIHTHLKGDTDEPELYRLAAARFAGFLRAHVPEYQQALQYVDIGGGFPAHTPMPRSRSSWNPQPICRYIDAVTEGYADIFPDPGDRPTLIAEPGRYLVCDSVIHLCTVHRVQQHDAAQLVHANATVSMLSYLYYGPQLVKAYTPDLAPRVGAATETTIYGSSCRENDILYKGPFPAVECGDVLIFFAAGSYNSTLAPTFIFEPAGLAWI